MTSEDIHRARAALAATIALEVALSGGQPVDGNPYVAAAQKRVDDAVAEADRINDPWNNP